MYTDEPRGVHALRAHIDRFEGPAVWSRLVLIFPLPGGTGDRLGAGHSSGNGCRLGPPESVKTGQNGSWQLWLSERRDLEIERKRRLLHDFFGQKMRSACTNFPYAQKQCFSRKSTFSGSQIRPAHSSL